MATTPPNTTPSTDTTIHISFKLVGIVVGVIIAAVAAVRFGLMHSVVVAPGQEAVFIDKPYFWGKQGVRDEPLQAGRKTEFNTTTEIFVTVFPQARAIKLSGLPSKDSVPFEIEATATFRVTDSPDIIRKFGPNWYEDATKAKLYAPIRAAIGRRMSKDLMTDADTIRQVELEIAEDIRQMLVEEGIAVELTDFNVQQVNGVLPNAFNSKPRNDRLP